MIRRYWFLFILPVVMLAGGALPAGGTALRGMSWLTASLVALLLFISGLGLDVRRIVRQALNARAILLGVASTYVVAPTCAYFLATWWGPEIAGPESIGFQFLQAMMLAAAQSSTLATAVTLTRLARGEEELALVLTLFSSILTAVLTPIVLERSIGAVVSIPVADMMGRIALVVVLPVIFGQIVRFLLRRLYLSPPANLRYVQQGIILVFVYVGFSAAAAHFQKEILLAFRFLGACASLHACMLVWTYAVSTALRLSAAERVAAVYSGSQKTVPNGIYLWDAYFAANPFGAVPIVLHQICQLVAGFALVHWLEPTREPDPEG